MTMLSHGARSTGRNPRFDLARNSPTFGGILENSLPVSHGNTATGHRGYFFFFFFFFFGAVGLAITNIFKHD